MNTLISFNVKYNLEEDDGFFIHGNRISVEEYIYQSSKFKLIKYQRSFWNHNQRLKIEVFFVVELTLKFVRK